MRNLFLKASGLVRRAGSKFALGGALLGASTVAAMAQTTGPTLDTTAITTFLSGSVTTAVTAVGSAVLLVIVGIYGFKWVRRAL